VPVRRRAPVRVAEACSAATWRRCACSSIASRSRWHR
jgi:hypothetical protein